MPELHAASNLVKQGLVVFTFSCIILKGSLAMLYDLTDGAIRLFEWLDKD